MDGDIAPLPDLALLAERYDAMLMVDDAHGTGVLGKRGRGTVEHFGLEGRVQIQMGTLGKPSAPTALRGGRPRVDRLLVNSSRSYIFSTSLPRLSALHRSRRSTSWITNHGGGTDYGRTGDVWPMDLLQRASAWALPQHPSSRSSWEALKRRSRRQESFSQPV